MLVVQRLAGVLLQVQALDADGPHLAVGHVQVDGAVADDRLQVLRDLIAGRQVGIEVVLALEDRGQIDRGIEAEAGADRLLHAELVDHRQHAGHGRVHRRDLAVGLAPEGRGRTGEQLGVGDDLGVHLEPDHHLPLARLALHQGHVFFTSSPTLCLNLRNKLRQADASTGSA